MFSNGIPDQKFIVGAGKGRVASWLLGDRRPWVASMSLEIRKESLYTHFCRAPPLIHLGFLVLVTYVVIFSLFSFAFDWCYAHGQPCVGL